MGKPAFPSVFGDQMAEARGFGNKIGASIDSQNAILAKMLAEISRGQALPERIMLSFSVSSAGWSMVTAPNPNATFVSGLWFGCTAAGKVAWGHGQSDGGAAYFIAPGTDDSGGTPGQLPFAANGGSNMTASPPNYVFRIEPGEGLMVNWAPATEGLVNGYALVWYGDLFSETPPDRGGLAP